MSLGVKSWTKLGSMVLAAAMVILLVPLMWRDRLASGWELGVGGRRRVAEA